jgi:hypothetical protein
MPRPPCEIAFFFFSFFLLEMNDMEGFFNHMNSSVLRSVISRMNQQEFEECMEFIKARALELPAGTRRQMFVSMFVWCQQHQANGFPIKEPHYLIEGSLFN